MSLFSVLLRTLAQETASQRALRKFSKEVKEEVNIHVMLVKGVPAPKHTSQEKGAASHREQIS